MIDSVELEVKAARIRREPAFGWIQPTRGDKVINDTRDGYVIDAIARRNAISVKTATEIILRAVQHGHLESAEARAVGAYDQCEGEA